MDKHIPGIPFCKEKRYDCMDVILDSILALYGYPIAEVCFNRWGFRYRRDDNLFTVDSNVPPLGQRLLQYGIRLERGSAHDFEEAWAYAKALIDRNLPVCILADVYYLVPYYFPRYLHAPHYIILSGYSESRCTVHFVDPSPWQPFQGDIRFDDLQEIWNVSRLPELKDRDLPPYHALFLQPPSEHRIWTVDEIKAVLRANVTAMSQNTSHGDVSQGIEGIRAFAYDVLSWRESDLDTMKGRMRRAFDLLRDIALGREIHATFLSICVQRVKGDELLGAADHLRRASQGWFVARNMFYKGILTDPPAMLPRVSARLLDVASREQAALNVLCKAINNPPFAHFFSGYLNYLSHQRTLQLPVKKGTYEHFPFLLREREKFG